VRETLKRKAPFPAPFQQRRQDLNLDTPAYIFTASVVLPSARSSAPSFMQRTASAKPFPAATAGRKQWALAVYPRVKHDSASKGVMYFGDVAALETVDELRAALKRSETNAAERSVIQLRPPDDSEISLHPLGSPRSRRCDRADGRRRPRREPDLIGQFHGDLPNTISSPDLPSCRTGRSASSPTPTPPAEA
jgi:hypothetical protein